MFAAIRCMAMLGGCCAIAAEVIQLSPQLVDLGLHISPEMVVNRFARAHQQFRGYSNIDRAILQRVRFV